MSTCSEFFSFNPVNRWIRMGKGNFMNNYFQRMSVLLVTAFLNHLSQRPWAQTKNLAPLNILIYRNQSRI